MHDTAHRIGGLVMDAYLPAGPARILEIGALDINGALRAHAPRNAEYTGLDFAPGKGVDIVVTGLHDWDVPDAYFDFVAASSVFEHDLTFWNTFLAMCRKARPGGHVYINAPSNGAVHRYPNDCWRFYPDAGLALEHWARESGCDIIMIESFVAEREADGWNDFCAIFRLGPCGDDLKLDFVHTRIPVTNAMTWRSSVTYCPSNHTEDMRLLHRSREDGNHVRMEGDAARRELDALRVAHDGAQANFAAREAASHVGHEAEVARLENLLNELTMRSEALEAQAMMLDERCSDLDAVRNELEEERGRSRLLAEQKGEAERRLHDRFREIARLSVLIEERERTIDGQQVNVEWLRRVAAVLTRGFSTSRKARLAAMLPAWFREGRQRKRLRREGLFFAERYTAAYPDVVRSGTDPLRHYITCGIVEGRVVDGSHRDIRA